MINQELTREDIVGHTITDILITEHHRSGDFELSFINVQIDGSIWFSLGSNYPDGELPIKIVSEREISKLKCRDWREATKCRGTKIIEVVLGMDGPSLGLWLDNGTVLYYTFEYLAVEPMLKKISDTDLKGALYTYWEHRPIVA